MSVSADPRPGAIRAKQAQVWDRDDLDWYVEPQSATRALLSVERFVGRTWDPACGRGNVVEALRAAGMDAIGTDIVRRAEGVDPWWDGTEDFLMDGVERAAVNIVTNPPYFRAKGTEAFIRKGLRLAVGKVAVFVDIRFLASRSRAAGLYSEASPHRVWILGARPSCPPGSFLAAGNEAGGGTADYCWLVWDLTAPPATRSEIGWIAGSFDGSTA